MIALSEDKKKPRLNRGKDYKENDKRLPVKTRRDNHPEDDYPKEQTHTGTR